MKAVFGNEHSVRNRTDGFSSIWLINNVLYFWYVLC